MNSKDPWEKASRALPFTLIELLIVLAIIGILAALLLPSLQRGREYAKSIVCLNHLKQDSLAMFSYAGDNRGLIGLNLYDSVNAPNSIRWLNFLMGDPAVSTYYTKKDTRVYCPTGPIPNLAYYEGFTYGTLASPTAKLMTATFRPAAFQSGPGFLKLSVAGSTYPLLMDAVIYYNASLGWQQICNVGSNPSSVSAPGVHLRHLNGANVVYSDGHAKRADKKVFRAEFGINAGFSGDKVVVPF